MRIVVKGLLTPLDLRTTIGLLADRFVRSGVDDVLGLNLYLTPRIQGEDLILIDECDQPVDKLEVRRAHIQEIGEEGRYHRLVHPSDRGLLRLFQWFAGDLSLSPAVQREILGGASAERWLQLVAPRMPELTASERGGLLQVARMLAVLERLCGEKSTAAWLLGPNPLSTLPGDTPAAQLRAGGRAALDALLEALEAYALVRERAGLPPIPPSAGFDAPDTEMGDT